MTRPPDPLELSLPVGGMTCATCAGRVERFLRRVPGVEEVRVDLVGERAFVRLDPLLAGRDELAAAIRGAGYEVPAEPTTGTSEPAERRDDGRRLLAEALLALGVGALAMVAMLTGAHDGTIAIALLAGATLVQVVSGARLYRAAWRAAKARSASMETLIAIGTSVAYLSGLLATLAPSLAHELGLHGGYLEIAPVVIGFVLLGRYIERRARARAREGLHTLAALRPPSARLLVDGVESLVALDAVPVGAKLLVRAGERIPLDGVIVKGGASIDESAVSGESLPQERAKGERVLGGSTLARGEIVVRTSATGAESLIGRMIALVEHAQSTRPPIARLADRIAARFVPAILLLTVAAALGWGLFGPEPRLANALSYAIALLVVACPCALGLATPVALAVSLGRAASAGILVRDATVLEATSRLHAIVFDKTGTLTRGRPDLVAAHDYSGDRLRSLAIAAGLEAGDEHPIGGAVLRYTGALDLVPASVDAIRRLPGRGARGRVGKRPVAIGSRRLALESGVELGAIAGELDAIERRGATAVLLFEGATLLALFEIADTLRPEAAEAIGALGSLGIECWIASGDSAGSVALVGERLGIPADRRLAEVLPEAKGALIARLRERGPVAMVGDGVNDAPALAGADLGIAIGSGASVARDAAALTIVRPDLRLVGESVALARATIRLIRGNLAWAFAYNLLLLPLAAGLARPLGLALAPELAALAMALSSIAVVLNALRLRRMRLATSAF